MSRRTKIVATIGPASDDPKVLEGMISAGMDVARIGLAHDDLETSLERFRTIRKVAQNMDKNVGILVDLPGPKIRTTTFKGEGSSFLWGEKVKVRYGKKPSIGHTIEVDYENLVDNIAVGDEIGFGDGSVALQVENHKKDHLECKVLHGGTLVGRPGVRIPAERVDIPTPTAADMEKLSAFLAEGVDLVALSFVRSADDIHQLNLDPHPKGPMVVAKIETNLAVQNLSEIVRASGAVMVARGDLGINYPLAEVPHLQKQIIRECITHGRPVITATQMLESMIHAPTPTRAEVSDIANAVFDGTSAVMLSAETAVGNDPELVISTMAEVAHYADENFDTAGWGQSIIESSLRKPRGNEHAVTNAVTMAGARVSEELDLKAIICISGTGLTVRSMARFRPDVPILGFSTDPRVVSQLTLSWGVKPFLTGETGSYEVRVEDAITRAKQENLVSTGDLVAVLAGLQQNAVSTDVLRLMKVE